MNKIETLQKAAEIRKRCPEVQFRMAVQHLFEVGRQNFDEAGVEETKANIRKENPSTPIMTAEFQCKLLDLSLELSKLPFWDVLLYVKLYLGIEGDDTLLLEAAEQALHLWQKELAPQSWKDACENPDTREEILRELIRRRQGGYTRAEINAAIRAVMDEE